MNNANKGSGFMNIFGEETSSDPAKMNLIGLWINWSLKI